MEVKYHNKYAMIEKKIEEFLFTINTIKEVPKLNKNILFQDGSCMGSFWQNCKTDRINRDPYNKLLLNHLLKTDYENYLSKINKKKGKNKMSIEDKIKQFSQKVNELKRIPTMSEKFFFDDGCCMGSFWHISKMLKMDKEPYIKLLQNSLLKNNYDNFIKNKRIRNVRLNINDKVNEFINKVNEIGELPGKDDFFEDGSCMKSFWQNCKFKKLIRPPYSKLLENEIIKKNYNDYTKRTRHDIKINKNEKVDSLIEKVIELNKVIDLTDEIYFENGSSMGVFWYSCKTYDRVKKEPYNKLLTIPILNADYEKYMKNRRGEVTLNTETKVNIFFNKVLELGKIPPINNTILFNDGCCMGRYWSNCKILERVEREPYKKLMEIKILQNDYELYQKKSSSKKEIQISQLLT